MKNSKSPERQKQLTQKLQLKVSIPGLTGSEVPAKHTEFLAPWDNTHSMPCLQKRKYDS